MERIGKPSAVPRQAARLRRRLSPPDLVGHRARTALATAGLALAASLALAQSSGQVSVRRWVVGAGGGQAAIGGRALQGSIGQPAIGTSSNASVQLAAGFWPGVLAPTGGPSATATSATPGPSPTPSATSPTSAPTASSTPPSGWVVNTTADDDGTCDVAHCSLRGAISAANAGAGGQIAFRIPADDGGCDLDGVCTIRLSRALPEIAAGSTVIDGFSQPGAEASSAPFGAPIDAALKIVLDGSAVTGFPSGIDLRSDGNVVRGLVVHGFYTGIQLYGANDNRIEGNFVGTDRAGQVAVANRCSGVSANDGQGGSGSSRNTIGGAEPADRNLISANGCAGVELGPGASNRVIGNYIGTDCSGARDLGNQGDGVYVFGGGSDDRIGGAGDNEPNIIAGNGGAGVRISGSEGPAVGNTISRNRIHDNLDKGIVLQSGGNASIDPPEIEAASATQVTGRACPSCTVELFSDPARQGMTYEATVTATAAGTWTMYKPAGFAGPNVTATATDGDGNTSEFSSPVAIGAAEGTATVTPTTGPTPAASATATPVASAVPGPAICLPVAANRAEVPAP
jgi:CSLREA domain-containing protein